MQITRRRALSLFPLAAATASAQFQQAPLQRITAALRAGDYPNTHALLIEQNGRLVYEQYFSGTDERWGFPTGSRAMTADSLHDLRSVSKSVTSALVGIALGRDFEAALARPIAYWFRNLKISQDLNAVTLHHVLTFTAGLEWNEMKVPYTDPKNDELQLSNVKNPVQLVLARPLREKPGSTWYYNGGLSQVLGGVVQKITGKRLDEFAREALFAPLGITKFEWLGAPNWEPPHLPAAASGLRMQPRDLAHFGSLYLHQGRWHDKQIIPAEWVERSLRRQVPSLGDWAGKPQWGYGYQWWIGKIDGHDVAAAVGNGNQRVYILAKENMVVTVLAGEYNKFEGHSERLLGAILAAKA